MHLNLGRTTENPLHTRSRSDIVASLLELIRDQELLVGKRDTYLSTSTFVTYRGGVPFELILFELILQELDTPGLILLVSSYSRSSVTPGAQLLQELILFKSNTLQALQPFKLSRGNSASSTT